MKSNPYLNLPDEDGPEEIEPVELPAWPELQLLPVRWTALLLILTIIVVALRFTSHPNEIGFEKVVISDTGAVYKSGDVIEHPIDADSNMILTVEGAGKFEMLPGSSVKIGRPRTAESSRFRLEHGRILIDMSNPDLRSIVEVFTMEVSTLGSRMFIEAWGEVNNPRFRVGMFEGTAGILTDEDVMLGLVTGEAMFSIGGRHVYPLARPVNNWPARNDNLGRWVFTGLNKKKYPSIDGLLNEVSRQIGMKLDIPKNTRLSELFAPVDYLDLEPRRAQDVLDDLGTRYGFRHSVFGNKLYIRLLTQDEQLSAIGERILFSFGDASDIPWPGNFTRDESTGIRERLDFAIGLAAMPLEARIGALTALIASREVFPDDDQLVWDAELGLVTDFTQPWQLRRIAFRDLYNDPELPAELGMSIFDEPDLLRARSYHRLRAWSTPAWADEEMVAKIENAVDEEIEATDDAAGVLLAGLWRGVENNFQVNKWMDLNFFNKGSLIQTEIPQHLNRLSYSLEGIDVLLMRRMLKKLLSLGTTSGQILSVDAIRRIAPFINRDPQMIMLVTMLIVDVNDPISPYAALCRGRMVNLYHHPEDSSWIETRVAEISDPKMDGGDLALFVAGNISGLETFPGLAEPSVLVALEKRAGEINNPMEILRLVRLMKAIDNVMNGEVSYKWLSGAGGDGIRKILTSGNPDHIIPAVVSLNLHKADIPEDASAIVLTLRMVMGGYSSHTDPRLRLLAAQYFTSRDVPASEAVMATLANDEYPRIAQLISGN